MALISKSLALLIISCFVVPLMEARQPLIKPGHNLETRLLDGGGLVECWNSLVELRSCTNEIILFFLNGESYMGLDCCRAIRVITRHCWPSMLTSLGFTAQEGDILRGYCNALLQPKVQPPALSPLGVVVGEKQSGNKI